MNRPPVDPGPRKIVVPAGAPIEEAASRVGASCWIELALHQVITGWLVDEPDPKTSTTFWALRAHRAQLAEEWHRRRPELREMPRDGFVVAPRRWGERLSPGSAFAASADRANALREVLQDIRDGYLEHQGLAVGPADAPVAETLRRALVVTDSDLARLAPPTNSQI